MMRAGHPQWLWLSLLAGVALLLYLFRRRARAVEVSTLLFFTAPAADRREAAWLRHIRKWLSYLLTAAVIMCGVLALARLSWNPSGDPPGPVLLLVDRSASMDARRAGGLTLWEEVQREMSERIEALPDGVPVSVIAYDARPVLVQPPTTSRREVKETLGRLQPRVLPGNAAAARAFAALHAGPGSGAEIWHVTGAVEGPGDSAVDEVRITPEGPAAANAGITAVSLRSRPLQPGERDLFVRVEAHGKGMAGGSAPVRLEIRVNGGLMQLRNLEIPWGGSEALVVPLRLGAGSRLEVLAHMEGDALAADDRVEVWVPEERPRQVAWVSEDPDPFVEIALAAIASAGRLGFVRMKPADWDAGDTRWSLLICDGWLPAERPGIPAVVIDPPQSAGWLDVLRLEGPQPRDVLRVAAAEHPVLFRVVSGRAGVAQTARVTPRPGLEPLWLAGDDPVLLAGLDQGGPLVILGFSPRRSDRLAFSAVFPLLLGNALYWCAGWAEPDSSEGAAVLATGSILESEDPGRAPASLRWIRQNGAAAAAETNAHVVELDRTGLWEMAGGRRGSAALLSAEETREAAAAGGRAAGGLPLRAGWGGATAVLLAAALGLLLWESWLFHRRGVY
ncbi:MAG TPA: BatA and WFA domain-containing protein [Verrucomicrobiales bacterium]|nr:BatA and WFA domain-containing protein [Verrucomicrobiales bacterium]